MSRAAMLAVLVAASPLAAQRPRWTAFEGIRLGGAVDDVLARGGDCFPGDAAGALSRGESAFMFAQHSFGPALPHSHQPRDSAAIRRALGVATLCRVTLGPAQLVAAAVDRRVIAVVVYFRGQGDSGQGAPIATDSIRRLAYTAWGRPTHHATTLDTWHSARYRSYFLAPPAGRHAFVPPWARADRLIMLDIAACTAFDRRVHRAGAAGEVGEC
jgi:hypothetical protein